MLHKLTKTREVFLLLIAYVSAVAVSVHRVLNNAVCSFVGGDAVTCSYYKFVILGHKEITASYIK